MKATKRSILPAVAVAIAATVIAACGGDPTAPDSPGRLSIRLTDAPIQDVTSVNVFIEGLKVKRVGEPERNFPVDVGTVDLLTLEDSSVLLATHAVEAGEYEYIMVELDESRSNLVVGFFDMSVRIPSEKIKVFGPFEVNEDGTTTVTLDFDARESLKQLGNGSWLMTPIIVIDRVEFDS